MRRAGGRAPRARRWRSGPSRRRRGRNRRRRARRGCAKLDTGCRRTAPVHLVRAKPASAPMRCSNARSPPAHGREVGTRGRPRPRTRRRTSSSLTKSGGIAATFASKRSRPTASTPDRGTVELLARQSAAAAGPSKELARQRLEADATVRPRPARARYDRSPSPARDGPGAGRRRRRMHRHAVRGRGAPSRSRNRSVMDHSRIAPNQGSMTAGLKDQEVAGRKRAQRQLASRRATRRRPARPQPADRDHRPRSR